MCEPGLVMWGLITTCNWSKQNAKNGCAHMHFCVTDLWAFIEIDIEI